MQQGETIEAMLRCGAALHLDGVWFIEIQCQAQCQARRHVIQEHLKHIGRFCGPNGNLVG